MIYLLDTSAVLIHYRQEPGCELSAIASQKHHAAMPSLCGI